MFYRCLASALFQLSVSCGIRDSQRALQIHSLSPEELWSFQLLAPKNALLSSGGLPRLAAPGDTFRLPKYQEHEGQSALNLWATWYNLHRAHAVSDPSAASVPLRGLDSVPIGPRVSTRDWCFSAMEGSAAIQDPDGSTTTYNYAGTTDADIVDCSQYFRHDVSRTKFRKANGIYGDGVKSFKLVPYRSVAVDSDEHIPFGSILYIPDARGVKVQLPDGSMAQHDGYFFAADTGGAIKGDHIDVFLGSTNGNPFPWVKSKQSGKFSAYLVDDLRVRNYLETLHN